MNKESLEFILVIVGAVLAYLFGKIQHNREYKENLRHELFGTLISIDLPKIYLEYMNDISSNQNYNSFSSIIKEINGRLSILIIFKNNEYKELRKILEQLDELITFNEYIDDNGIIIPSKIDDFDRIEIRKKDIHNKIIELYSHLGIDDYKGVLYQGKLKQCWIKSRLIDHW